MKKIFIILVMFALNSLFADNLIGEYVGTVKADRSNFHANPQLAFQVYREGDTYKIGIYQDLWKRATPYLKFDAKAKNGVIEFENKGYFKFTGKIDGEKVSGTFTDKYYEHDQEKIFTVNFELPKLDRKSPTLGMVPPSGAQVLFDGKNLDQWRTANNMSMPWKVVGNDKDAYFEVAKIKDSSGHSKGSDIVTKKKFKNDFKLHLEFMIPDEMGKTLGQHRANSGAFMGRFEVQILDSFGADGMWNECGALYKFMPPQINASLPPLVWQTYDIEYKGPKYVNGKMTAFPKITVFHNGMQVHKDVELKEATGHEGRNRDISRMGDGPVEIKLQDHDNPIAYRNIWIVEENK